MLNVEIYKFLNKIDINIVIKFENNHLKITPSKYLDIQRDNITILFWVFFFFTKKKFDIFIDNLWNFHH